MTDRTELSRKAHELRTQEGRSWEYIGGFLGVHRKTAKRLADEFLKETPSSDAITVGFSSFPPTIGGNDISLERFQPIHVYGDAVLTCDWHVPLHDPRMVNSLLEIAHAKNMKKLVIAGDFFNQDATSQYLPHQREAKLEREREDAIEIFTALLQVFDEVIFTSGNHDYRLVKFWNHTLDFEYLVRWMLEPVGQIALDKITISYLDYLIYHPSHDRDIYVCHPENFSSQPLNIARSLVPKYNMSVLTAHSHHFAQGVAADGKHLVFDGGGLFSLNKTEYIKRTNRHHVWAQGFYVFQDGIAQAYSPLYGNM